MYVHVLERYLVGKTFVLNLSSIIVRQHTHTFTPSPPLHTHTYTHSSQPPRKPSVCQQSSLRLFLAVRALLPCHYLLLQVGESLPNPETLVVPSPSISLERQQQLLCRGERLLKINLQILKLHVMKLQWEHFCIDNFLKE